MRLRERDRESAGAMPQHCEFKYQVALRVSVAGAMRIFENARVRDDDTKGCVFCSRHVCKIHAVDARGGLDSRVKRNQLKTQSRRDSPDCDVHFVHDRTTDGKSSSRWTLSVTIPYKKGGTVNERHPSDATCAGKLAKTS